MEKTRKSKSLDLSTLSVETHPEVIQHRQHLERSNTILESLKATLEELHTKSDALFDLYTETCMKVTKGGAEESEANKAYSEYQKVLSEIESLEERISVQGELISKCRSECESAERSAKNGYLDLCKEHRDEKVLKVIESLYALSERFEELRSVQKSVNDFGGGHDIGFNSLDNNLRDMKLQNLLASVGKGDERIFRSPAAPRY